MGDMIYRELISDMTWSYSRIIAFYDCPYKWYMKYIAGEKEEPRFYASYGSFMHKLIEQYYRGELKKSELVPTFLRDFSEHVQGARPQESTVEKYLQCGIDYLEGFKEFPYNMVDVEKRISFDINGNKFVGVIDFLGEKDGEFYIVDNKSRELKPRSNRKKPTQKDMELDDMLKQLYVYAAAVKKEYGKFPKALCFNCFKNNVFIEEPFDEVKFNEVMQWVADSIEDIKDSNEFYPNVEFFGCYYLCGLTEECCYWQER